MGHFRISLVCKYPLYKSAMNETPEVRNLPPWRWTVMLRTARVCAHSYRL
jgi:hypothetical protein